MMLLANGREDGRTSRSFVGVERAEEFRERLFVLKLWLASRCMIVHESGVTGSNTLQHVVSSYKLMSAGKTFAAYGLLMRTLSVPRLDSWCERVCLEVAAIWSLSFPLLKVARAEKPFLLPSQFTSFR